MSLEEYFQLELTSKERHDFHEGEVYALAGASKNHARIIQRLVLGLVPQLEGSSCELFAENVRTEIQVNRTYVYPDIVVDCDGKDDPLQIASPVVLMEVLSPSTEGYDRGFKLGITLIFLAFNILFL